MDIRKESLKNTMSGTVRLKLFQEFRLTRLKTSLLPILRVLQNRVLKFRRTMTSLLNSQEETTLLPL